MVNRPARQHYVPRFYLEQFADPDGLVWTYEKGSGRKWSASAENTATETNVYSTKNEDGTYNDQIEKMLSLIESDVAPIIPKIRKGGLLDEQEKAAFCWFVASLFVRSPTSIRIAAEIAGNMAGTVFSAINADRKTFDASMREMKEAHGEHFSPEEFDEIWAIAKNPKNFSLNVSKSIGLIAFGGLEEYATIFYRMNFSVVTTKDQHLITSDNPLVSVNDPRKWHPFYGGGGFFATDAMITLPLSPDRLVEFYWKDQLASRVYELSKQRGRLYNRQRAGMAEKYLFASRNDHGICKLAQKYSESGVQVGISNADHIPEVKVVRRLDEK